MKKGTALYPVYAEPNTEYTSSQTEFRFKEFDTVDKKTYCRIRIILSISHTPI